MMWYLQKQQSPNNEKELRNRNSVAKIEQKNHLKKQWIYFEFKELK